MKDIATLKKEILAAIPIYKRHGYSAPYIADSYGKAGTTRTLVITDFIEMDSGKEVEDPHYFYNISEKDANEDVAYPTKTFFTVLCQDSPQKNKVSTFAGEDILHCIVHSYILRPLSGHSNVNDIKPKDLDEAIRALFKVFEVFKPEQVVFRGLSTERMINRRSKKSDLNGQTITEYLEARGIKYRTEGKRTSVPRPYVDQSIIEQLVQISQQFKDHSQDVPHSLFGAVTRFINLIDSLSGVSNEIEVKIDSSSMDEKTKFIVNMAERAKAEGQILTADQVAHELNKAGLTTLSGEQYQTRSRGIYRLISAAYKKVKDTHPESAFTILDAIQNPSKDISQDISFSRKQIEGMQRFKEAASQGKAFDDLVDKIIQEKKIKPFYGYRFWDIDIIHRKLDPNFWTAWETANKKYKVEFSIPNDGSLSFSEIKIVATDPLRTHHRNIPFGANEVQIVLKEFPFAEVDSSDMKIRILPYANHCNGERMEQCAKCFVDALEFLERL